MQLHMVVEDRDYLEIVTWVYLGFFKTGTEQTRLRCSVSFLPIR